MDMMADELISLASTASGRGTVETINMIADIIINKSRSNNLKLFNLLTVSKLQNDGLNN